MLFNLPVHFDIESRQYLFLVLNYNHVAIPVSVRLKQFAVEILRNLVLVSSVGLPEHHPHQKKILAVNLGDVRELREIDPVAVSKSPTLGQQKALVHD